MARKVTIDDIAKRAAKYKLTYKEVALEAGMPLTTVYRILMGTTRKPRDVDAVAKLNRAVTYLASDHIRSGEFRRRRTEWRVRAMGRWGIPGKYGTD